MRLLPKSEVDKAKALDRQREVEEGKKLANRVDNLRKLHSEEEATLQSFRSKTLSQIQEDINQQIAVKDSIESEIKAKREELLTLSGPLDKAWKYYVTSEKAEIDRLKAKTASELAILERKLEETALLTEEMQAEKRSYLLGQQENIGIRASALKTKGEAEEVLVNARTEAQTIIRKAEILNSESTKRAAAVASQARVNAMREELLKKKEEELEEREMQALAKELLYYSPIRKNV